MLDALRRLFTFDAVANREALASVRRLESPPERAWALLAHIAESKRAWLHRLRGEEASTDMWPVRTPDEIAAALERAEQGWADYLDALTAEALARPVTYRNTQGAEFSNERADVLLHVAMHAQEHRGQIGDLVGAAGGEAAQPEYIWWLRGSE